MEVGCCGGGEWRRRDAIRDMCDCVHVEWGSGRRR